jgi:hypothetical protein
MTLDTNYLKAYEDQGFVIIPDLITPEDFPELQAASERAIARARSGSWKHRRTVGSQFPPYDDKKCLSLSLLFLLPFNVRCHTS